MRKFRPSWTVKHSSPASVTDDDDGDDNDDNVSDFIIVDNKSSATTADTDKNVDKLLKFVADNDIQMVRVICVIFNDLLT